MEERKRPAEEKESEFKKCPPQASKKQRYKTNCLLLTTTIFTFPDPPTFVILPHPNPTKERLRTIKQLREHQGEGSKQTLETCFLLISKPNPEHHVPDDQESISRLGELATECESARRGLQRVVSEENRLLRW